MTAGDVEALADRIVERLRAGRDDRPLLSPAQTAERLGISERLVRDMLRPMNGRPPRLASLTVETARKIEPAEVDRYLAEQRRREGGGAAT